MSYSVQTPCGMCAKKDTCKDGLNLSKGVQNEIHTKTYEEGHQGSGNIILTCFRMDSVTK
jgi:hypothetical protein